MPVPREVDPLSSEVFRVYVPVSQNAGSRKKPTVDFASISEFNGSIESIEIREVTNQRTTRKFPGRANYEPITLSRGVDDDFVMYNWWKQLANPFVNLSSDTAPDLKRKVSIDVLSKDLETVRLTIVLYDAWPSGISFGPLSARRSGVLINSVELSHDGFEVF